MDSCLYYTMQQIENVKKQIEIQKGKIEKYKDIDVDPIYEKSVLKKLYGKLYRLQYKLQREQDIMMYGGVRIKNNLEFRHANDKT